MIERCIVFAQLFVHRVVKQQPVKLLLIIPLDKLPELRAHEAQLLARMRELIAVQRAESRKLLLVAAEHFVKHGLLPVHDLVVRIGEDEVFRKSVHHGKRQLIVAALAEQRIGREIVERIVHVAHVPLEAEAESADGGRHSHHRIRR